MKPLLILACCALALPALGQTGPHGAVGLAIGAYEDIRTPIVLGTSVYPQIAVPLPIEADIVLGGNFGLSVLAKPVFVGKGGAFLLNGLLDLGAKYWLDKPFAGLYFRAVPLTVFLNQSIAYLESVNLGIAVGCGYDLPLGDRFSAGFELRLRAYYYGFSSFHGSIDGVCRISLLW